MIRGIQILICTFIFSIIVGYVLNLWHASLSLAPSHSPIRFTVAQGENIQSIARRLEEVHIIAHAQAFEAYVLIRGRAGKTKAGSYQFAFPLNGFQVSDALVAGKPKEQSVRIIEGWTLSDIGRYLSDERILSSDEFAAALARVDRTKYSFLDQRNPTLEGYLFPDTYRIFTDERRSEIVEKMLDAFQKKVAPLLGTGADYRVKSDAVILASILEREVQKTDDRRRVADIFYRRLNVNMPLQADSTVNYITGKNNASVSIADTSINSPYNTYKHKGLPPTPICNPGAGAIEAALRPEPNQYWYFLTTPDGRVVYSTTYEEHLRNKRIYLTNNK